MMMMWMSLCCFLMRIDDSMRSEACDAENNVEHIIHTSLVVLQIDKQILLQLDRN